MKFAYLIDKQDRWCSENNNGSYIIEVWSDKTQAIKRAKELDLKDDSCEHLVMELGLDVTEEEYMEERFGNV